MDEKEIEALAHRMAWRYAKSQDPQHSDTYTFNRYCLLRFAGELLANAREAHAEAPAPAPLTDAEILNCFDAAVPNYVDVSDAEMIDFARAIERAHGIGTDAAPAPHPDTADAERWRHVWQCVRMAQHGEYVLLPDEPTGLPDDSIVRARFLQEVDAALDAARAHGIGASTGSKP